MWTPSSNWFPEMRTHRPGKPIDVPRVLSVIRRWPSRVARQWVRNFVTTFCQEPSVLAIVAYGSAVRDVPSSADVDLLFVFENSFPHFTPPPFDVDVRGYEKSLVDDQVREGHDLLGWAVRHGVVLCERDSFWTAFAFRWRGRVPLPSAIVAEERAEKAERIRQDLLRMGDKIAAKEQLLSVLTHSARSKLLRAGIYPGSRPELPQQLKTLGEKQLAEELSLVLSDRQ
jgi:hypothetical protein